MHSSSVSFHHQSHNFQHAKHRIQDLKHRKLFDRASCSNSLLRRRRILVCRKYKSSGIRVDRGRDLFNERMPAACGGSASGWDLTSFDNIDASTFLAGLMPKKEIGADRFVEEHPSYDGRGVVIAIFDSGVDPAAAGLQTTSDGKPKLIEIVDCTGSGDVDTSKVVLKDEEGFITGASGTKLHVNSSWVNPSGDWRVGCKLVYQLFPESLSSRLKKERKKKWDEKHREATTEALRQLAAFDLKNPKPTDNGLKKQREDLQNRIDALQKITENYEDKGPVIDAVVWHDGEVWRVALDTQDMEEEDGLGKLEDFTPLTNYKIERKYGIFTRMDACSFVTNVYDNGDILSIVTDCSPHGTHVAGITAAHHPEEPLLNGIAPGAQLISCKIGDTRLGSMETGIGLTRALITVIENKCDLINMSYGEPTRMPDYGRFIKLADEVVNKHGVIFVSSAGNNGPSLSTVGAPGGTSSSILGIGAYVSPVMASAAHSIVEPPSEGLQYTWSSRGPTADGDLGVCLSAPGGAVAPVPKWTLQRRMLMNGTSMASPCACGGVALLLSYLKAVGRPISPYAVRKALENTAASISSNAEETLTAGRGLMQVDKAFEYLEKCKDKPSVWYTVQVTRSVNSAAAMRGVYLREVSSCQQASEWAIQVRPKFPEDADKLDTLAPFEERIRLETTDSSWVNCPEYLLLTYNGRTFNVVVDPTKLNVGVHYAEVIGVDCAAPWRGPLFRVPITVVKPVEISCSPPSISFSKLSFTPGHIERMFIAVPDGATWAEATLRLSGFDTPRKFFLNAVQLPTKTRPLVWENVLSLTAPSSKSFAFAVDGGLTMEFTVAQFWSSGSGSHVPTNVDIVIEFRGLVSSKADFFINGSDVATRVDVKSPLSSEKLVPAITLNRLRTPYRPSETKLEPLSAERDKLTDGRQINALTLTYKFSMGDGGKVTPRFPFLNNRIYDNEFESQMYMISDINKRVLSIGDVYPKGIKLQKGEYTLRLYIRHDNMNYLEKLKKSVIFIDRRLEEKNFIRLNAYNNIDGAITGTFNLKSAVLAPGESKAFYIASPTEDKAPKDASVGSLLMGKITFGRVSFGSSKSEQNGQACPSLTRLVVAVAPPSKSDDKSKEKDAEPQKTPYKKIEEEVRDVKIKILSLLPRASDEEKKEWSQQAQSLKTEYSGYIPLLTEILQRLSKDTDKNNAEIIEAANEIMNTVNKDVLVQFFAMKSETEDADAAQVKKEMEMQRDALVEALSKKIISIADEEEEEEKGEESQSQSNDEFEESYGELRKWVEITSSKYGMLNVKREKRFGRLGSALKVVNEMIQDESKGVQKNLFEMRIELLEKLGWKHWVDYERNWLSIRFPSTLSTF